MTPYFSVGVTTYKRPQLLRRCLRSLLAQTFADFEVIVGNDDVTAHLNRKELGISDRRVRIVNHEVNLGERANLNRLLELAEGRFFTWQFDDDYYSPHFLQCVADAHRRHGELECVFTSYTKVFDGDAGLPAARECRPAITLSGSEFVRRYLSGNAKAMGLTGVYEVEYLRRLGGAEALTSGPFALYSEHLLILKSVLLPVVAYIDAPLVSYYVHDESWGNTNTEFQTYREAATNLLERGLDVLTEAQPWEEARETALGLFNIVVHDYLKKCFLRPGLSGLSDGKEFLTFLARRFDDRIRALGIQDAIRPERRSTYLLPFFKSKSKRLLPAPVLKRLQKIHARFQ